MEDALARINLQPVECTRTVLILVLMEDALALKKFIVRITEESKKS